MNTGARMNRLHSTAVAIGMVACAGAACAAESAYTKHDWDRCRKIAAEDDTITRRCAGFSDIPVLHSGGEDAASVGFGARGMRGDWPLTGFFFPKTVIEWRSEGGKPFAAILRYDVGPAIGGPFRSRLVVYRLEGAASSCAVAAIDGGKPDANETARKIADEKAHSFVCDKDAPPK